MKPFLSPEFTVKELLDRYPPILQLFVDLGPLCPGCPAEAFLTLADISREYRRLDLDQLRQRIDTVIESDGASQGDSPGRCIQCPG